MKREAYLSALRLQLEQNDFGPVEEAIAYFNDLLEDRMSDEGMDEETAVASMEPPEQVAAQLKESRSAARTPDAGEDSPAPGVRTYTTRADLVRRIHVRDRNTALIILGEEREDIQIRHPETKKVRYQFSLQDGTLSLIREEVTFSLQFFLEIERLSKEMRQVELRVPKELAAEIDLRTSNSKLTLENIACWGKVEAVTSNAPLKARNLSGKSLSLQASNGSMTLENVSARQAIHATTSNAKITVDRVSAPSLKLKTSNATITVDEITSDDITLTTSNGAIRGELPGAMGDYAISSGTSNGKNTLPPMTTGSGKRLSAHTSNAGISLRFRGGSMDERDS